MHTSFRSISLFAKVTAFTLRSAHELLKLAVTEREAKLKRHFYREDYFNRNPDTFVWHANISHSRVFTHKKVQAMATSSSAYLFPNSQVENVGRSWTCTVSSFTCPVFKYLLAESPPSTLPHFSVQECQSDAKVCLPTNCIVKVDHLHFPCVWTKTSCCKIMI